MNGAATEHLCPVLVICALFARNLYLSIGINYR